MKFSVIILILIISILPQAHSQIWEEVSTPFDYVPVNNLISINDVVYVSRIDWTDSANYNYQLINNEWIRAIDDTLYEIFGKPNAVDQFNNRLIVSCSNGVFLSEDSASNWTKLPDINHNGPQAIDLDVSPNGIFAIKKSFESHLFKYDEINNKWEQLDEDKQDTMQYFFIKQIESNSTNVFALQQKTANPIKYKDTLSGGLFVSTDKGENWEKTLSDSTLSSMFVSDEYVLVSTKNGKLWKSEDNGKTWSQNNIGSEITNFTLDGNRIIATSYPLGIIESRDNGKIWQVLNESIYNSHIYKKDDKYFLKHYNLVYESDSLFTEIKPTNLIYTNTQVNNIYDHNDTLLCVGTFSRGVQYSTDMAKSWQTYYPFLEDELVRINKIYSKDNQFYLTASYILYSSTDYGKTFEINRTPGISDLLILDDKILFYGPNGRFVSKDYGKTYSTLDTTEIKNNFRIGKIAKTKDGGLIAFSTFSGVFKSSDNAETWTKLIDALPTDTTFDSVNDFYEFNDNYYAVNTTPLKIFKSSDKGDSWETLEIKLFDEIQYFFLEMIDENNIILSSYGEGLKGLRITNDQGKTWRQIDEDLPPLSKDKFRPYGVRGVIGNQIFVGSSPSVYGGSLYRTTLDKVGVQTSVESEIEDNYLYTYPPYPLPSQNEVKVLFYWDINLPMEVEDISIYDLSGKKIITDSNLRIEKQANHYGNLVWDCSTAQPGIYIINITHGTEEKAVKVIVE